MRESNFANGRFFECVLRELVFCDWESWFFLLGINFCEFQEDAFYLAWNYIIPFLECKLLNIGKQHVGA